MRFAANRKHMAFTFNGRFVSMADEHFNGATVAPLIYLRLWLCF